MQDWRKLVVKPTTSVTKVIETLNDSVGAQIVLVSDEMGKLLGTITDGDLRRYMLAGKGLDGVAKDLMNDGYKSVSKDTKRSEVLMMMRNNVIRQLPIIGDNGVLEGVTLLTELLTSEKKENLVLIMAGGKGTRLHPLTKDCPKPMLHVGGKPILETILRNFADQGFSEFVISINYLSSQITDHFGDGERFGVHITYLQEEEPMGTAGAISLLADGLTNYPIVIVNGDVLTRVRYSQLLDFHAQTKAGLTVCLRDYKVEVPFGVVNMEGHTVGEIVEKPILNHYVNAGIYVLNPELINRIQPKTSLDMPGFINFLIGEKVVVTGFPLHEYWMDVGHHEELKVANQQYESVFLESKKGFDSD